MTAAAGSWFAVPRRGRVEDAVGAALGAVRGAAGARVRSCLGGIVLIGCGQRVVSRVGAQRLRV
jgi:hypothetical protein